MPLVLVGGAAPDYPGENYVTISGLLTRIKDIANLAGWTTISDQIASNQLVDLRSVNTNINLRVSYVGDEILIRGDNDGLGTVLSTEFNAGYAIDNDPNRLYACFDDNFGAIGVWSNNLNQMGMSFAGEPEVFHDDSITPYPWYIGQVRYNACFDAEVNVSAYNGANWQSFRKAQNFSAGVDLETANSLSVVKAGTYDRYTIGTPYQGNPDNQSQENVGFADFRGNPNDLDGKAVLSSFYLVEGRDFSVNPDGRYSNIIIRNGLEYANGSFYRGKWNTYLNIGAASYQQRTILQDEVTGRIYVTGPPGFQAFRIA